MPALSHANAATTVAVVLAIVVAVAVDVLALLVALVFPSAYDRGVQDKTAQRSSEYLMGRRDLKAC